MSRRHACPQVTRLRRCEVLPVTMHPFLGSTSHAADPCPPTRLRQPNSPWLPSSRVCLGREPLDSTSPTSPRRAGCRCTGSCRYSWLAGVATLARAAPSLCKPSSTCG
ncbi:hypothetical protein B566_EDAN014300, partial [Ephemera danica]